MFCLRYMCLFTYCGVQHISVSPGACRRIHVLTPGDTDMCWTPQYVNKHI
jgi:hypothetical protein